MLRFPVRPQPIRLLPVFIALLVFAAWEVNPLPFPLAGADADVSVGVTVIGRPETADAAGLTPPSSPEEAGAGVLASTITAFPVRYGLSLALMAPAMLGLLVLVQRGRGR